MSKTAVKIAVWEREKGWGAKIDDYMVCLTTEDALAFKKTFNAKNTSDSAPSWYMQCEGDPIPITITQKQHDVVSKEGRGWLSALNKI